MLRLAETTSKRHSGSTPRYVYEVWPGIEEQYQYGFSNVVGLKHDGILLTPGDGGWGSEISRLCPRSGVAWSDPADGGTGDFFIVEGGNGDVQNWWCFGMRLKGKELAYQLMQPIVDLPDHYEVAATVESEYPYGFSRLALLVENNWLAGAEYGRWPGGWNEREDQSVIAWSDRGDLFLVTSPLASFDEMGEFLVETLQPYIREVSHSDATVTTAFVLDGGSSSQMAWRWCGPNATMIEEDSGAPRGDRRYIPSFIGLSVPCRR